MGMLCNNCSHWFEEHTTDGCNAPGCDCPEFKEITDPTDPRHNEESD